VLDELTRLGGSRYGVQDLFQGRIVVRSTVDARVQTIVNEALEHGLAAYEKRHPRLKGLVQGSVVVLATRMRRSPGRGWRAAGLPGSRGTFTPTTTVPTSSLRQAGSAMKPLVYLAAGVGARPRLHGARRAH